MAEQPVMIARFSLPTEAQVACGRLQAEGIMAHVLGDGAASAFGIMVGLGGHVELYVSAADADRAQKILAECMPEEQWRVMLDKESQALETNPAEWTSDDRVKPGAEFEGETDSRLWVCSLCGDAVSIKETVCPSCGTAREALRPARSEPRRAERSAQRASSADVQAEEPTPSSPSLHSSFEVPEVDKYHQGDALARRALISAMVAILSAPLAILIGSWIGGVVNGVFFVIALFFLVRLMLYSGEMSPRAVRQCYAALALDLLLLGYKLLFWCASNAR